MFEPRTHYCHLHLVSTSLRYKRKIHVINYSKVKFYSKKLMCLISLKYELYKLFSY